MKAINKVFLLLLAAALVFAACTNPANDDDDRPKWEDIPGDEVTYVDTGTSLGVYPSWNYFEFTDNIADGDKYILTCEGYFNQDIKGLRANIYNNSINEGCSENVTLVSKSKGLAARTKMSVTVTITVNKTPGSGNAGNNMLSVYLLKEDNPQIQGELKAKFTHFALVKQS
jgi:hypothetical protein